MSRLFLLSGTLPRDSAVEQWFAARDTALGQLAREWFEKMRACGEDVRETLHDGCPVACVGEAAFAYVNVFSKHVNVGFYQGSLLEDPAAILLGEGKWMRHVKLRLDAPSLDVPLGELVVRACDDMRRRLALPPG